MKLNVLTSKDTILLSISHFGEKIFEHTLEEKQTLFSCGKFYGLKMREVYYYNPHLKDSYKPGQKVTIPIPNKAILRYKPDDFQSSEYAPIYYKVRRGDTFYGISTRLFKMPLDTIFARNNLNYKSKLERGNLLFIGWMSVKGIPADARLYEGSPIWKKSFLARMEFIGDSHNKTIKTQKGAAFWQNEKSGGNDLYALHRTAKVGSIISITNPMFKRTVYVKVIGKIPERAYQNNAKVVVSRQVAKMLGAKDEKFYVEVKYY